MPNRMLLAVMGFLLFVATPASAQRPEAVSALTFELETRARWLHGSQRADLIPFAARTRWIHLDSTVSSVAGGRTLHVRTGQSPTGVGDPGRIEVDRRGIARWISVEARVPSLPSGLDAATRRSRELSRNVSNGEIVLPETDLWDLAPGVPPDLRAGVVWSDTFRVETARAGARHGLRAVRVSEVLGDTVIGGVRLWHVRDSTAFEYSEWRLDFERSQDTVVTIERNGSGVVRGRHLYDPTMRLYQARSDTTSIDGAALLAYPDGRQFHTPARYERYRRWRLYDAVLLADRKEELRAEAERNALSMVTVPRNETEQRLRDGDMVVVDSLLAVWRATRDPDQRAAIQRTLLIGASTDTGVRATIDTMRFEAGDTAYRIRRITAAFARRPVSFPEVRLLLAFQEDPGLAFAHGLESDRLYISPAEALLRKPPAITEDPRDWPCAPEACRALGRQWETAAEPRLRDLGLITNFLMDPQRWDRVFRARVEEGSWLARFARDNFEARRAQGP